MTRVSGAAEREKGETPHNVRVTAKVRPVLRRHAIPSPSPACPNQPYLCFFALMRLLCPPSPCPHTGASMGNKWWLHGMGMFCEAYVLFAVGNLQGMALCYCTVIVQEWEARGVGACVPTRLWRVSPRVPASAAPSPPLPFARLRVNPRNIAVLCGIAHIRGGRLPPPPPVNVCARCVWRCNREFVVPPLWPCWRPRLWRYGLCTLFYCTSDWRRPRLSTAARFPTLASG